MDTSEPPEGGFNPLFSGLTLKVELEQLCLGFVNQFQSPIFGADAQSQFLKGLFGSLDGFNPLFSGLTLKDRQSQ